MSTSARSRPPSASAVSRISRSPERKTSTSPLALAQQLLDGVADRVGLVAVGILGVLERPVAHLDRVGAPGDLDHRGVAEVAREALGVDRRRRDDHLQVRPLRQDPGEVAEQEVDVEAALVRLVDDDRVVAAQQPVVLGLGQQQAVGHEPDQACPRASGR